MFSAVTLVLLVSCCGAALSSWIPYGDGNPYPPYSKPGSYPGPWGWQGNDVGSQGNALRGFGNAVGSQGNDVSGYGNNVGWQWNEVDGIGNYVGWQGNSVN
ncbi:shematrin-like protein 2 [Dreissena polymorpha]|uniref:Uncharacterized protein n=1 Tax=Dreissena polymorpha TaxID=45954 RepID=A0A9D4IZU9_DREPO|nr:shematrin-like protein 2 [Dreissena polymorpha]KAH3790458.1 hypothetical protein DPMN_168660 [Dreissena polymorpha]